MPLTTILAVLCLVGFLFGSFVIISNIRSSGPLFLLYPPAFVGAYYLIFFLFPSALVLFDPTAPTYRYSPDGYSFTTWLETEVFAALFILIAIGIAVSTVPFAQFRRRLIHGFGQINFQYPGDMATAYRFLFVVLPFACLIFFAYKFGGEGYRDYLVNRTMERQGLGFFLMPSLWFSLYAPAAVAVIAFGKLRWQAIVPLLGMIALFTLLHLYLGSKSRGLIVVVYCALVWLLVRSAMNKVSSRHYLMVAGLGFVMAVAGLYFGDLRESATRNVDISAVDTRVGFAASFSKFNAFGGVENTAWLIENVSYEELLKGRTFAAVAVGLVPRAWWPEKPTGGGPALRNLIHPGSYDLINGFQLSSYSPGIIAEAYMNFGYAGVILISPLLAFLMIWLARAPDKIRTPLDISLGVILLYRLSGLLTSEVFGVVSGTFQLVLPVVIFRFMFRRFYSGRSAGQRWQDSTRRNFPHAELGTGRPAAGTMAFKER